MQRELRVRETDTPEVNYSNCQSRGSDIESDDDLLSLEEFFRTAPRPKISTTSSKIGPIFQHLEQSALSGPGMQIRRTKLGLGEGQGNSPVRRTSCPS